MESEKNYQSIHEQRIFIGGADDVKCMIENEHCDVVIDLRAEKAEMDWEYPNVRRVHVPLVDKLEGQEESIRQAIDLIINEYKAGKNVAIHCAAGRSRTGSVAMGTLLALGITDNVEDAQQKLQQFRPDAEVHPVLKESLQKLFPAPGSDRVLPSPFPQQVKLHEKKYDDFLIRWITDVSFEMEGHDQPYMVTLVSEDGEHWRSNGVRFYSEEEAGKDIESRWLLNEGNHKQLDKVVEKLTQDDFIQQLTTVITKTQK